MIYYFLIKVVLAAGIMWLFYKLVLFNEPTFRFNRLYLLLCCCLPFIFPLFRFGNASSKEMLIVGILNPELEEVGGHAELTVGSNLEHFSWEFWLQVFVLFISVLLLIQFIRQLYLSWKYIRGGELIAKHGYHLVLTSNNFAPQSFFRFLFVNIEEYKSGKIAPWVVEHELVHIRQKHSWDIIWVELLKALFWFNPFLYLISRAIRLNHEFLADQAVIKNVANPVAYQQVVLEQINRENGLNLACSFNFKMIKKRFLMMTSPPKTKHSILKQVLCAPILLGLCVLFARPVRGQISSTGQAVKVVINDIKRNPSALPTDSTKTQSILIPGLGLSEQGMEQYEKIINDYGIQMDGTGHLKRKISKKNMAILRDLYREMDIAQRKQQPFNVWMKPAILRSTPSKNQLEEWSQKSFFHVFINGKRVENEKLNQYKNYQFARHEVNLASFQTNSGGEKRYWKVELMLPEYYMEQLTKARRAGTEDQFTFMIRNR